MTKKRTPETRTCTWCGTKYPSLDVRTKYCSKSCKMAKFLQDKPGYMAKAQAASVERDPVRRSHNNGAQHAKARGATGTVTIGEWREILEAHEYRCAYCGEHSQYLGMDHVVPISCGGEHIPENVVPSCITCNQTRPYCKRGKK